MRGPGSRPSLLFQLVVPATALFIITILSLIAVLFSDERAPVAQWLNRHGNTLLLVELIVVIALSLLAMAVDRWQTLRAAAQTAAAASAAAGDADQRPVRADSCEPAVSDEP